MMRLGRGGRGGGRLLAPSSVENAAAEELIFPISTCSGGVQMEITQAILFPQGFEKPV